MDSPDRSTPPKTTWFDYRPLPSCQVTEPENGVTLHIVDNGTMPAGNLSLVWEYGRNEAYHTPGGSESAGMAATLLAEGTSRMSGEEIAAMTDFHGAVLNARATDHHSYIDLICLNDSLPELVPLIAGIFSDAKIPDKAFQALQTRMSLRRRMEQTQPATVSANALSALVAGKDHPSACRPTAEEIEAISRDDVYDVYRQGRETGKLHIFFGGKADNAVIDTLHHLCHIIASGRAWRRDTPVTQPFNSAPPQRMDLSVQGSIQTSITAAIPAIGRNHPDYIPLRLTVMALGGYFGSRLMTNIREDKGLTYGISAALCGQREGAYISIGAQCPNGVSDMVINEIGKEMTLLGSQLMDNDELTGLRRYASSQLMSVLDSPFSIMGHYRNELIIGTPRDYFGQQFRAIEKLSADTIAETAAKYLVPEQMRIVTAGG